MWFGDLVTMQWWDDLWLKESFADFMGAFSLVEATRFTNGWITFANNRKAWAYRADQLPSTHPVTADIRDLEDAKLNFDGITYAKGALGAQAARRLRRPGRVPGGRAPLLQAARVRQHPARATCSSVLAETSGRDMTSLVARRGCRRRASTSLTPQVTYDARGPDHRARRPPGGRRLAPGAAAAPGRGGPVPASPRTARWCATPAPRPTSPGARTVVARAGRGRAARPGPGQRRRPDVLQDPLRRGLPGHAARPPRRHHRPAGAGAVLVGAVEPDAGRADARPGLRRAWCCAFAGRETRHRRPPDAARLGAVRARPLRRAGLARGGRPGAGRGRAARSCGSRSRAASTSWPGPGSSPPSRRPDADLQLLGGLLAGTAEIDGLDVDQELRWAFLVPAGRARRGRRGGRGRRAGPRRHGVRQAAPRAVPGRAPLGRGQGPGVGGGGGVGHAVQRARRGDDRGLRAALAAGAAGAVHRLGTSRRSSGSGPSGPSRSAWTWSRACSPGSRTTRRPSTATDAWLTAHPDAAPALRRLVLEARDDLARALRAQECDARA